LGFIIAPGSVSAAVMFGVIEKFIKWCHETFKTYSGFSLKLKIKANKSLDILHEEIKKTLVDEKCD